MDCNGYAALYTVRNADGIHELDFQMPLWFTITTIISNK